MRFEVRHDGEYQIHAGSLELRAGQGHLAAVVVERYCDGQTGTREVFRDVAISGGHRWLTSEQALHQALELGAGAVAAQRRRAQASSSTAVASHEPGLHLPCP